MNSKSLVRYVGDTDLCGFTCVCLCARVRMCVKLMCACMDGGRFIETIVFQQSAQLVITFVTHNSKVCKCVDQNAQ